MRNEWQDFFNYLAPVYMDNAFTRNTIAEIDFILAELGLTSGDSILDVGCGTGRHSIELARRGLDVTGIDLSSGMLKEAKRAAQEAVVKVEFIQADASKFNATREYHAAICLCEGAFGLLGKGDDPIERDLKILENISRALLPGGGFLLTALNALSKIRRYSQSDVEAGKFDPATLVETVEMPVELPDGGKSLTVYERGYVATELILMHRIAGLQVEKIYGGTSENWGHRPIDMDEIELMLISRKI